MHCWIELKSKVKAIYGSRVLNNEINKKAQNFSHSIRILEYFSHKTFKFN